MSFYYKAKVQYDGTGYYGFQWQTDLPTVQDEINRALGKLVSGKITTMGASRTDTGVHALEQCVKITSEKEIACDGFVDSINKVLSSQIRFLSIVPSDIKFRPANDSIGKEYRYLFTNTIGDNHATRRFIANNPYPLDLGAMKKCAEAIVGSHDFKNFVSTGSNVKSTIREIRACELSEREPKTLFASSLFNHPELPDKCFELRFEANGFLKQMIRHLMTAMWKVGNGRLTVEEFMFLLNGPKKSKSMWKVAHPKGLFLWRINYPDKSGDET